MINKVAIFSVFLVLLTLGPSAFGQSSNDWNSLNNLPPEFRLIVELKGGRRLKGKFEGFEPNSLRIRTDGKSINIGRDEVSRVYRGEKRSRVRSALIGAGIGLGVGVAVGVLHERNSTDPDGLAGVAGVLYGVPAGAAIGAAAGGRVKKGSLLYEAR
jgi:small nuclear ribonucleoprotein (snRNP)-like protein